MDCLAISARSTSSLTRRLHIFLLRDGQIGREIVTEG
jgi:hypothetical protein